MAQITYVNIFNVFRLQLEQVERLRSEDAPRRLMITHTIKLLDPKSKQGRMTLKILVKVKGHHMRHTFSCLLSFVSNMERSHQEL